MIAPQKPLLLRDVAVAGQARVLCAPTAPRATAQPLAERPDEPLAGSTEVASQAEAQQALERQIAEAFDRAREEGLREGLADAKRKLDEAVRSAQERLQSQAETRQKELEDRYEGLLARLDSALGEFQRVSEARLAALETDAAELAFQAVCRLAGPHEQHRRFVVDAVAEAFRELGGKRLMRIQAHPDDLAALTEAFADRFPAVEWRADADLKGGGCLIDTDMGTLDARLDAQLELLRDAWVRAGQGQPSEGAADA